MAPSTSRSDLVPQIPEIPRRHGGCGCEKPDTTKPLYRSNFSKHHDKSNRKPVMTTINCLDYSKELNLIAFGGNTGKIGVLDSCTLSFKGLYNAYEKLEVASVHFNDAER